MNSLRFGSAGRPRARVIARLVPVALCAGRARCRGLARNQNTKDIAGTSGRLRTPEALMTSATYTWDNAMIEGRRRLALLEQALDATTLRWFDAIGVAEGWKCFELGAGGGSIVEALCSRVGVRGEVSALDMDARFLRTMPYENLNVQEANVVTAEIPTGHFDLVHTRWTLMHIPERDAVLERLV